jgi:hypothetical protein
MIPINQEWRVKEKTSAPALIAFDNDMDLLDDDESPLIKDQHALYTTGQIQGCQGGRV